MATTVSRKEKKEKKFNSERTARQVKASLKAVFPKEVFIVNSLMEKVEVMYFDTTSASQSELNMFTTLFCTLGNVKKEQLLFSKVIRAPAAASAAVK